MGRATTPGKISSKSRDDKKRTEQSALFASSPAIVYHGTGPKTRRDPAFIFNDSGVERFIRQT